jgi:hypothetical protein
MFDASIQQVEEMFIRLNRFSLFYILFVLFPTLIAVIYNLFWTTYQRQLFYNDIEYLFITILQFVLLVLVVWMTRDTHFYLEKYIDTKNEHFVKDNDVTNKTMFSNQVLTTRGDMLSGRYGKEEKVKKNMVEHDLLRGIAFNGLEFDSNTVS